MKALFIAAAIAIAPAPALAQFPLTIKWDIDVKFQTREQYAKLCALAMVTSGAGKTMAPYVVMKWCRQLAAEAFPPPAPAPESGSTP